MGATESLQIFPDSYINTSDNKTYIHVKNAGTATAVIYKIEIVGVNTTDTIISLTPGNETTLTIPFTGTVTAGANYQVKLYTKAGNVYSATVKAV